MKTVFKVVGVCITVLVCSLLLFFYINSAVQTDPLPSWVEGTIKSNLLQFISETTQEGSPNYIPVSERIAVFDQDGTLWVEQPFYTQFFFAIDRVKALAPQHPEWNDQEPFKSILTDNIEAIKAFTDHDYMKIIAATHAGMSVEEFSQTVKSWLEKAEHPRFKKPFTDLVYQPMLEVIQLFKANSFKTYIVSGGGQDFIRAYAEKVYGIPPEHVIGSASKVKYEYDANSPVLKKLPEILLIDDKAGKPETIYLMIGRRPYAAFGNSIGDRQMLEWTQAGPNKRFMLLVYHDDAEREYAYGADSKIGTFSSSLRDEAEKKGWFIVSMKNDWKKIFPGD